MKTDDWTELKRPETETKTVEVEVFQQQWKQQVLLKLSND